ncbi:MAG: hypothetical protein LBE80_09705 [Deltaproteobacteria bacterium]|nr:hypothetical protein [Deltaproteobacteria bacterium]
MVKGFMDKYLSVDQITVYLALLFSVLFIFYFWRDFKFSLGICFIISLICLALLYYLTCKDFTCDVYKYLHLYLVGPALYCLNGPVNRSKFVLLPPAALLLAVIFTYNFELPFIICFVFIAINIFYIIKFLIKYHKQPLFLPYLKQMIILAAVTGCAYIISLHLSKQMYFRAYKFMTSWFS